ncbi:MAG: toxin-antitoxin system YwqK family antitoxin [Flavobacteriaceae bacterium]|nr:toxin-antitoxin system YwqK family antitoxin [Bacteroidia bacterium]NNF75777.1 toxin-antitoxin system YwqK family antitoxin [Flavobacteriaceae bacterium]NNK74028.1 toxin-antitoxin system YwqK family antitoxin [Flavobacteriaceae bacterium]
MLFAQEPLNQFDDEGQRHGKWSKNFKKTDQLRYQGQFNHGKEIGEFKYYQLIGKVSKLAAIKQFDPDSDEAFVKFLSLKGKTISEGKMRAKTYIGTWRYYHKNSDQLMTLENYDDDGKLNGKRIVYYVNGQVAEELNYNAGLLVGESNYYAMNGTLVKHYNYENDVLHGPSKHWDENGQLLIEGQYKRGKKNGIWTYYKNGEVLEEKDFSYVPKYKKKN